MNTNIKGDFQICISVPLMVRTPIHTFQVNFPFLYRLNMLENQRLFVVFRGYKNVPLTWNESMFHVSSWKKRLWVGLVQSYHKAFHHHRLHYQQHHQRFENFIFFLLAFEKQISNLLMFIFTIFTKHWWSSFFDFLERPLFPINNNLSASFFPEFQFSFRFPKIYLSSFLVLMMSLASQSVSIEKLKHLPDIGDNIMLSSIAIIDELFFRL